MPWWWDIRNTVNNKLIRFLLNHCWIDASTLRKFVYQVSNGELQVIMNEKKEWDSYDMSEM